MPIPYARDLGGAAQGTSDSFKTLPPAASYRGGMTPRFDAFGLVVADMGRALAFYRRLGLAIPAEADTEPHVEVTLPGGVRLLGHRGDGPLVRPGLDAADGSATGWASPSAATDPPRWTRCTRT